ncbi:MAG: hypothetical protein KKA84_06900 [Bacteroidetes bacterium]|nr:hypothetical protein [Bacteroidota bacterium]
MFFQKSIFSIITIFLIVGISSCQDKSGTPTEPNDLGGRNNQYLGQTPPGMVPVKFAPNNSYLSTRSWWWQSSPVFSPDSNEMYFVKYFNSSEIHEIWFTKRTNGVWSEVLKAPFSTGSYNGTPMFLESNDTLYFYSHRPEGFVFRVTRTPSGWSEPAAINIPLPANTRGYSFHMTKNKTIYFGLLNTSSSQYDWSTLDIYRTRLVNGQYTQPENIGTSINTNVGEGVGYVDPNERFIIYESNKTGGYGQHDMYISYGNPDDTWNAPVNLGAVINTNSEDSYPSITADGKYFFFVTQKSGDAGYATYWVDVSAIEAIH